jgi:acyl carrier protein
LIVFGNSAAASNLDNHLDDMPSIMKPSPAGAIRGRAKARPADRRADQTGRKGVGVICLCLVKAPIVRTPLPPLERSMSIRLKIISAMQQVAAEQKITLPPLDDDLSLHETGFDSLGFAILVARLEDELGIDPFTISEDAAFPLTIGDFIKAYENVPA